MANTKRIEYASYERPTLADILTHFHGVRPSDVTVRLVENRGHNDAWTSIVFEVKEKEGTPDSVPRDFCDGPHGCQCHTR